MNTETQPHWYRSLSYGSILFGILGGAFCWWLPLGMVLSITGLLLGVVDWIDTRRRSLDHRLAVVGLLVSAAALALCIFVAALGLQTVTFTALR
jgi:hypothetical protein